MIYDDVRHLAATTATLGPNQPGHCPAVVTTNVAGAPTDFGARWAAALSVACAPLDYAANEDCTGIVVVVGASPRNGALSRKQGGLYVPFENRYSR